jgi:protein-arginine kinase
MAVYYVLGVTRPDGFGGLGILIKDVHISTPLSVVADNLHSKLNLGVSQHVHLGYLRPVADPSGVARMEKVWLHPLPALTLKQVIEFLIKVSSSIFCMVRVRFSALRHIRSDMLSLEKIYCIDIGFLSSEAC